MSFVARMTTTSRGIQPGLTRHCCTDRFTPFSPLSPQVFHFRCSRPSLLSLHRLCLLIHHQRPSSSSCVGLVLHVAHSSLEVSEMGLSVVPALKARVMAVEFVKNNPRIKAMLDHPAGPFTSKCCAYPAFRAISVSGSSPTLYLSLCWYACSLIRCLTRPVPICLCVSPSYLLCTFNVKASSSW